MPRRLPHETYTPQEYAKVLRAKYGRRADRLASDRYDAAQRQEVAVFYDRVIQELGRF